MTQDVDTAVSRIETLLEEFRSASDPEARERAEEIVRLLLEIYGQGLARVLELIRAHGDGAGEVLERLARDKLVASLLLIHGLHPVDAETRIRRALDGIGRRLGEARIVFQGAEGGVARIRIEAGGSGCGSSAAALADAVRRAVEEAAPELERVEVEGAARPASSLLVQIAPGV